MDCLRADSLNWALAHILRFGDTDVLPVPFEYQAIKAFQHDIIPKLASVDLKSYRTKSFTRQLIPKSSLGFRIVIQPDPIDTLIMNAAAYEACQNVESYRAAVDEKIACSYRLDPQPDGVLFTNGTGWNDFHEASKINSNREDISFVVVADIADFYSQVYHHRLENALESSGVTRERAKNIETILQTLTANTSSGIPVGPTFSAVFAEATLADVDSFLQRKALLHTRYVDDFRIFTTDYKSAVKALHDLTEYLHNTHRLSLQGAKTRILTKQDFIDNELYDPSEAETAAQKRSIIDSIIHVTGYSHPFDEFEEIEIPDDLDIETVSAVLSELYTEATTGPILKIGLAKHVLRRARTLRSRIIVPQVLSKLDLTLPILPDVIDYLVRITNRQNANIIGDALYTLISNSVFNDLPFLRSWCLHAFSTRPEMIQKRQAFEIIEKTNDHDVSGRYGALIARAYKSIDWVREKKETWANTPPSVQRAIVWASTVLPHDERRSWLHGPENAGDLLLNYIAKHARSDCMI